MKSIKMFRRTLKAFFDNRSDLIQRLFEEGYEIEVYEEALELTVNVRPNGDFEDRVEVQKICYFVDTVRDFDFVEEMVENSSRDGKMSERFVCGEVWELSLNDNREIRDLVISEFRELPDDVFNSKVKLVISEFRELPDDVFNSKVREIEYLVGLRKDEVLFNSDLEEINPIFIDEEMIDEYWERVKMLIEKGDLSLNGEFKKNLGPQEPQLIY